MEIKPEAITLNFLVGCFLSLSLSNESLIKYIADEIKQNDIKALPDKSSIWGSKEKAKRGTKNINRFLIQWSGLQANIKFLILLILILRNNSNHYITDLFDNASWISIRIFGKLIKNLIYFKYISHNNNCLN